MAEVSRIKDLVNETDRAASDDYLVIDGLKFGTRKILVDNINKDNAKKVYVTYEEFGAAGDGISDDGSFIKAAHEYANANGYSIKCRPNAKYMIREAKNIIVDTNVDFNGATIIFDENFASKEPIFTFTTTVTELTPSELSFLQNNLNREVNRYESVKTFNNYVVVAEDKNTVICNRQLHGGSEAQTYKEVFAVNEDGSVLNLNYQNPNDFGATLTEGKKYLIPETILTFKNAHFILTGDSGSTYKSYHRYIHIGRSNVVIENINVSVENDTGSIQRMFFRNEATFNVVFRNVSVPDFANKTSYSSSTYAFSNMNTIGSKYYNVQSPLYNPNFWGCFQSFYSKNIIMKDCIFSRFDSHFYGADIIIENCKFRAIQIQGYGYIKFRNVDTFGTSFMTFRDDYGGTWDGDIYIDDCKLIYKNAGSGNTGSVIKHFSDATFDYGYDTKIPNIFINNFIFEESSKMENIVVVWLENKIGKTDTRYITMPKHIHISNVINRGKPLKVMNVVGDYIGEGDIKLSNIDNILKPRSFYLCTTGYLSIYSLNKPVGFYSPKIYIERCQYVDFSCKNSICSLTIKDSIINRINSREANEERFNMDKLNIIDSTFISNCTDEPTAGVPVNRFIAKDLLLSNVYFDSLKINDVDTSNNGSIFFIGLFNETKDDIINDCFRVKINSSIAGYSKVTDALKTKLLNNIQ